MISLKSKYRFTLHNSRSTFKKLVRFRQNSAFKKEKCRFLVNDQLDAQNLYDVFIFVSNTLHVSSTSCSSSGETNCVNTNSGNCHSVLVAVSCAGFGVKNRYMMHGQQKRKMQRNLKFSPHFQLLPPDAYLSSPIIIALPSLFPSWSG